MRSVYRQRIDATARVVKLEHLESPCSRFNRDNRHPMTGAPKTTANREVGARHTVSKSWISEDRGKIFVSASPQRQWRCRRLCTARYRAGTSLASCQQTTSHRGDIVGKDWNHSAFVSHCRPTSYQLPSTMFILLRRNGRKFVEHRNPHCLRPATRAMRER